MAPASTTGILGLWERVAPEPPGRRALILLTWTAPGTDPGEVPAGSGNSTLLRVYEEAFGSSLAAVVACPRCQEALDIDVPVRELLTSLGAANSGGDKQAHEVSFGGHRLRFWVPTILDFARLPLSGRALLEACVVEAEGPDGGTVAPADLPAPIMEAVEQAMAALDPAAELHLSLTCPECRHAWTEYLDPVAFLSVEIEAMARRTLEEVHVLASSYGWSEAEVIALSPWRRRQYLEMATT